MKDEEEIQRSVHSDLIAIAVNKESITPRLGANFSIPTHLFEGMFGTDTLVREPGLGTS